MEMSSQRLPARLRAKWAPQDGDALSAPEPEPIAELPAEPEFKWLRLRIAEEKERQEREARILDRLPLATEELQEGLNACIAAYTDAFSADQIEIQTEPTRIRILVRHRWDGVANRSSIEILKVPAIPGFQIDRGGSPLVIEVGVLPDNRLFYRDREQDQYLTMEELTRRILDRTLFPKLGE